ncbi:MAG: hypothetical protein JW937_10010 [Candidatus Omnitrophica bacterium]|nr:hypothetical protein [Candidatus Omnitrophota bacterium]
MTLVLTGLLGQAACAPSFPPDKAAEQLQGMVKKEYGRDVKAFLKGKTLWVYMPLEQGLLSKGFGVSEEASDAIEDIVLCTHRIAMSTDDQAIQYYTIVVSDTSQIGAEFTLIGAVQDIKRARLLDISRSEFQKRLIREVKLNPLALGDSEGDHLRLTDISKSRFLAEQITRRIKQVIAEDPVLKERYEARAADWRYQNDTFVFLLSINDKTPAATEGGFREENGLLDKSLTEIATVLHGYSFEDYEKVTLRELRSNLELELSREEIELFHRGKLPFQKIQIDTRQTTTPLGLLSN